MCSDAIAQKTESARKQPRFSFRRNIAFIIYGGLYNGFFENFLFNNCFPVVFGEGTDLVTVASKVVVDQLILTPFLCLPAAYIVRALVFRSSVRDALSRYLSDAKKDLLWKYWLIWTPTQCLTFSVVPVHLRIGTPIPPPASRRREDLEAVTRAAQEQINAMLDQGLIRPSRLRGASARAALPPRS
jgi:hypothetical protein